MFSANASVFGLFGSEDIIDFSLNAVSDRAQFNFDKGNPFGSVIHGARFAKRTNDADYDQVIDGALGSGPLTGSISMQFNPNTNIITAFYNFGSGSTLLGATNISDWNMTSGSFSFFIKSAATNINPPDDNVIGAISVPPSSLHLEGVILAAPKPSRAVLLIAGAFSTLLRRRRNAQCRHDWGLSLTPRLTRLHAWSVFSLFKSWRFGLGYLAFVIAGSLLLLAWLRQREREESGRLFQALAQADAEFVRRMNLPRSEKLASDLAQLLGMHIEFCNAGKGTTASEDTLVIRLDAKNDMIFTRQPVASQLSLRDPATRNAFLAFWCVAGLIGWMLARERSKRAQTERLAMLGRVATSLAHDIKNPLASIQLHAQLMTPSNDEDTQAVQLIQSESEVISGLVNQWLHLANPIPPRLSRLDLAEAIQYVATSLEPQARHGGVKLEIDLQSPLPVDGDAQRLTQAFRNLIINAIQAMPRGGNLRISAEKLENDLTLRFADSGSGLSEAALARGTELFYTEKEGGMGVGLNIVASIIEAHGGRLSLQNDPKGGAVVTVSLPSPA